jgi:hypothetical protein
MRKKYRKLTKSGQRYIEKNPMETAASLAAKFGCSVSMIALVRRRLRRDKGYLGRSAVINHRYNTVRDMYPTHSSADIAKVLGITVKQVWRIAHRVGAQHTTETRIRIHKESPRVQKGVELMKLRIKNDKFRILSGEKPKYRMYYRTISRKMAKIRSYLVTTYKYFYDRKFGETVLFYDSETRRNENEQYFINKYHFEFKQADE